MPFNSINMKRVLCSLHVFINTVFSLLPPEIQQPSLDLASGTFKKTRVSSHIGFIRHCIQHNIIPTGFTSKFRPSISSLSRAQQNELAKIERTHSFRRMKFTLKCHNATIKALNEQIDKASKSLHDSIANNPLLHNSIKSIIHYANAGLFDILKVHKENKSHKFHQRQFNKQPKPVSSSIQAKSAVICIPPSTPLSDNERSVLEKGLNFIPLTRNIESYNIRAHLSDFYRRLRLRFHFRDEPPTTETNDPFDRFKPKSLWTPAPGASNALDLFIDKTTHDVENLRLKPIKRRNLSSDELDGLASLKRREDIIIKPADKGKCVVVWNKQEYLAEGERQLKKTPDFYSQIPKDKTIVNNRIVSDTIKSLIKSDHLPSQASLLHCHDSDLGKPCFYLLPKIHKMISPTPGRPIVSACSCPTEKISTFLDSIFQPIVQNLPTYVKDTTHALQIFDSLHFDDTSPRRLFLLDVVSLYTSIPHQFGLQALQHFLDRREDQSISTCTLLRLAELVLNLNSFEFNGQFFDQISGVAMGTKMGPSYACLFMGYLEQKMFASYTGPKPEIFLRYIDDGFGITSLSEDELKLFFQHIQNVSAPFGIKFTFDQSPQSVNFLDLTVSLTEKGITTTVHYKPTDSHSYLLYNSSHPASCKDSIPYSQFLRLRRICSDDEDFVFQTSKMSSFFIDRGYPVNIVTSALDRVLTYRRADVLKHDKECKSTDRVPLVLPFHPNTLHVARLVKANLPILLSDAHTREVFSSPPLIAYKRQPNLRDILVHSRLPNSNHLPVGTRPCSRPRCKTCPFIDECSGIQFPKGYWSIRNNFSCSSRNVVYAIKCKRCGMLYIGETGVELSNRFGHHRRDVENQEQKPVPLHFNQPDHRGLEDVSIFIMKLCTGNSYSRKATESRLIYKLGTLVPLGINVSHSFL